MVFYNNKSLILNTTLAPILLFVYNRPYHTIQVLDALSANIHAKESYLYIFCDGTKEDSTIDEQIKIIETRNIIKKEKRFKNVIITEHVYNKGLANSIIDGVSEVLKKFNSVIVLEDDILVSNGFLLYMNNALDLYENDDNVGCIHGWNYNLNTSKYKKSTFFLKGADCWGWATWRKSWKYFNADGSQLLNKIIENNLMFDFYRRGTHKFTDMLRDNVNNKNNSWAIRWHASLFLENKFCLHPTNSILINIGLDGSGTNCNEYDLLQSGTVDYINLEKIEVVESNWFFEAYKQYTRLLYYNKLLKYHINLYNYIRRLLHG